MITHRLGIRIIGKASHDLWRVPTRYSNIRKDERSGEAFFVGQKMITQERLKELVSYNPETGLFFRKVKTSNRCSMDKPIGTVDTHGYFWASIDGKAYRLHRLAFIYTNGSILDCDVDHINMDRKDNRIANLRQVDRSTNMQNKIKPSANNRSGFLGVIHGKRPGTFTAQIRKAGKNTHLGTFVSAESAYAAYVSAKREFHAGSTL